MLRAAATRRVWRASVLIPQPPPPQQRAAHLTASELLLKNERNDFLRRVYRLYHEAPENGPERDRLKFSGELFNAEWKVFRNRAADHAAFLQEHGAQLPKEHKTRPYRITSRLAALVTAASCRLEGNTLTVDEVANLNVPTDVSAAESTLVRPSVTPPNEPGEHHEMLVMSSGMATASASLKKEREVLEAYHHMLALYNGQAVTLGRDSFFVSESEFNFLHKILMHPFKEAKPGTYRTLPIGITNYHMAFFPFHTELRGLMTDYFEWLRAPPEGPNTHPFLRACDIFLVTAHLHPFQDGNGRMARMLASLAMAHGGCRPAVFRPEITRREYSQAVYEAQHKGKTTEFYRFCLNNMAGSV